MAHRRPAPAPSSSTAVPNISITKARTNTITLSRNEKENEEEEERSWRKRHHHLHRKNSSQRCALSARGAHLCSGTKREHRATDRQSVMPLLPSASGLTGQRWRHRKKKKIRGDYQCAVPAEMCRDSFHFTLMYVRAQATRDTATAEHRYVRAKNNVPTRGNGGGDR